MKAIKKFLLLTTIWSLLFVSTSCKKNTNLLIKETTLYPLIIDGVTIIKANEKRAFMHFNNTWSPRLLGNDNNF